MSPTESAGPVTMTLTDLLSNAEAVLETCLEHGESLSQTLPEENVAQIARILQLSSRIFGQAAEENIVGLLSQECETTTTEGATAAAALLEYIELSVFEFNLWHARIEQYATHDLPPAAK